MTGQEQLLDCLENANVLAEEELARLIGQNEPKEAMKLIGCQSLIITAITTLKGDSA